MVVRAAVAATLLALLAAGLWWTASQAPGPARPDGGFEVFVVGPSGLLHEGNVTVADADPLRVLRALARAEGFPVRVDDLDGCAYDYVRGVAGHDETASGGWNYYLRRADGDGWQWQAQSAACPGALRAGDDVLWCWVEPDERCAAWP